MIHHIANPTASALETLARTSPPQKGLLPYKTYPSALARVNELRSSLGITAPEQKIFNIGKLNARIVELEAAHAERQAAHVEKSIFERDMPEIRERCLMLEAELGVPHEPLSDNLLLARSRLSGLESEKVIRASRKYLASLPPNLGAPVTPAAEAPSKIEPELHGRARAAAAVRIFGAGKASPKIDPNLTGRARTIAAINAACFVDLTKAVTPAAHEAAEESVQEPKKELSGRARMLANMKIQNVTK